MCTAVCISKDKGRVRDYLKRLQLLAVELLLAFEVFHNSLDQTQWYMLSHNSYLHGMPS